jgi:hypothetical protein
MLSDHSPYSTYLISMISDYLTSTLDKIQKDYNNFKEKENLSLFTLKENFSKANLHYLALEKEV